MRNKYPVCPVNSFTVHQTKFLNFGEEGVSKNYDELINLIPGSSALVWVGHHYITAELLDIAGKHYNSKLLYILVVVHTINWVLHFTIKTS